MWGAGREGVSTTIVLARHGIDGVVLVEDDARTAERARGQLTDAGVSATIAGGDDGLAALDAAEVIVLSPGISRYRPDLLARIEHGTVVTGPTALALAELADDAAHVVVGVTGSKGKSTTTALLRHLLHLAGHDVEEGGNIGRPALELVDHPTRLLVLEVSSYQASLVTHAPRFAVLTALFPEHLDWHGDTETYFEDKLRLLRAPGLERVAVNDTDRAASARTERLPRVLYGTPPGVHAREGALWLADQRLTDSGGRLVGAHNLVNAAGALTAAAFVDERVLAEPSLLEEWLHTFAPLPHRLEPLGRFAGVDFVDDSIATSPAATVAALAAFDDRPVTVLVGGHDRSLPIEALVSALRERGAPTLVCTMPTSGERIADELEPLTPGHPTLRLRRCESLEDAVRVAVAETPTSGVVLLSPGAASYDRFTSYVHRGAEFRRLVDELANR
jgi:UDP-N-acetylmuramoylalanine--D-glutamate ligase